MANLIYTVADLLNIGVNSTNLSADWVQMGEIDLCMSKAGIEEWRRELSFTPGDKVMVDDGDFLYYYCLENAGENDVPGSSDKWKRLDYISGASYEAGDYVMLEEEDGEDTLRLLFYCTSPTNLHPYNSSYWRYCWDARYGLDRSVIGSTFAGKYDGQNCKIKNMHIYTYSDSVGFFRWLGDGIELQNINIVNANVCGATGVGILNGWASDHPADPDIITGFIKNCHVSGTVAGNMYSGGFAGAHKHYTFRCSAKVKVTGLAVGTGSRLGGFAGISGGPIDSCYCVGSIQGNSYLGGFAGSNPGPDYGNNRGQISNCYCKSTVTASGTDQSYIGGFIGINRQAAIENSYCVAKITTAATIAGGFAGVSDYGGTVTNCYYDSDKAGISDNYATGVPTSQLQRRNTFKAFRFGDVWSMRPESYPFLRLAGNSHRFGRQGFSKHRKAGTARIRVY